MMADSGPGHLNGALTTDASQRHALLLLAPSSGFGGGIERLATAIERSWGGRVNRVDLYRHDEVDRPVGNPKAKVTFAGRALRAARQERPDVVLSLHVGLLPVAAAVVATSRARLALFGIGTEVWGDLGRMEKALVRRCRHLLSISSFTRDVLAARASIDPARISTVPLPVDERILALAAAADDQPAVRAAPMLLTVSRVVSEHQYKGHRAIADGLAGLLRQIPEARWQVVGEGNDLARLRGYCRDIGVSHAANFEGSVSDVRLAELYKRALVHILPSVTNVESRPPTGEGFGLVYAEAAAFGVPSIASSAGGGSLDFVENEVTGLTVPVNDPSALTVAMRRLLEDPFLRRDLGKAARERVRSRHLPRHFAAELEKSLSEPD